MKLTGPACTEATNGAEEAERRERAEDNAGGVRVERTVRRVVKELETVLQHKKLWLGFGLDLPASFSTDRLGQRS